jgi:serine protease Do
MSGSTNQLVSKLSTLRDRKIALPVSLAAVAVLGYAMFLHGNGVHASAITASPLDDSSVASLTAMDHAMETLAARVTPAVVNVAVTSRATEEEADGDGNIRQQIDPQQLPPGIAQFFGLGGGNGRTQRMPQQPEFQHGVGSGVIISPDGYIVTNNHVVDGATQIKVTLHDRRVLNAKVIGVDKLTDLAVIKVDAHELPAVTWGDSTKLQPGQTVLAFGSPFGALQFSVTRGIVSALDRPNMFRGADARKPGGYIQTDAAINPGNSGGPLVNVHGELVGINTGIMTDSGSFAGAGFAIPEQIAKSTAEQIIRTGSVHHGYLGITMNDVTPENAHFFNLQQANGAIVAQVSPDSPASRAGLENGDVIEKLNGQAILNGSAIQLAISGVTPGTKVQLGVLRNGTSKTIDLTVGEYHEQGEVAANDGDSSTPSKGGKLGVGMADLTPDVRQQLGLPDGVKGAAIQSVRPGSPAEDAGLQPGDVVVQVNRKNVDSANAAVAGVHAVPTGQDVLLLVWSHGGESYRVVHPSQG